MEGERGGVWEGEEEELGRRASCVDRDNRRKGMRALSLEPSGVANSDERAGSLQRANGAYEISSGDLGRARGSPRPWQRGAIETRFRKLLLLLSASPLWYAARDHTGSATALCLVRNTVDRRRSLALSLDLALLLAGLDDFASRVHPPAPRDVGDCPAEQHHNPSRTAPALDVGGAEWPSSGACGARRLVCPSTRAPLSVYLALAKAKLVTYNPSASSLPLSPARALLLLRRAAFISPAPPPGLCVSSSVKSPCPPRLASPIRSSHMHTLRLAMTHSHRQSSNVRPHDSR